MFYFWLTVIIFLIFIEAMTAGLTTIWFVASALASLIISFFIDSFVIQFGVFVLLGTLLLITTRPLLIKYIKPKEVKTNLDRIIDMEGHVLKDITKNEPGEVKVDGKVWTAISSTEIKKDNIVRILEIKGNKIKVEKVEE